MAETILKPTKFELKEIIEPQFHWVAKKFMCGACNCIPLSPVLAPASADCGHIFCDSCSNTRWCALCEKGLPRAEYRPLSQGNLVTDCYAELPVSCPNGSALGESCSSEDLASSFGKLETCADDRETTDDDEDKSGEEEQRRQIMPPVVEKPQCGWKGTMQDMKSHLLECPFQFIQCSSGTIFRRRDTERHRQTECPCNFDICRICHKRVKALGEGGIEQMQSRLDELEASMQAQQKRQFELNLKEWQKRINIEEKMKEREKDVATLEKKVKETEGRLHSRDSSVWTWQIYDPEALQRRLSTVRYEESPEFYLLGFGPFTLRLQPSDDDSSSADSALRSYRMNVCGSVSTATIGVKAQVRINGKDAAFVGMRTGRVSDKSSWGSWCVWPTTDNQPMNIEVEFLEAKELRAGQEDKPFWVWDLEKPAEMKASEGSGFQSPTFDLAGLGGPWIVCIYPSGGANSAPGGVKVELWRLGSDPKEAFAALVEARISIGGVSARWSSRSGSDSDAWWSYGWWTNFPGLTWPQSDEAPLRVEVEVLQIEKWSGN